MNRDQRYNYTKAFTLIEIIVAVAISAILLLAINTILTNALGLRDRAAKAYKETFLQNRALQTMERDLLNIMPPNNLLQGGLASENEISLVKGSSQFSFYTTTGMLHDDTPWGDMQKVEYQLIQSITEDDDNSYTLVRATTRNLLSSIEETPQLEPLLNHVLAMQATYYDGATWTDSWDSSVQDPPLPEAIKITLLIKNEEDDIESDNTHYGHTLGLVVPIVAEEFTVEYDTESEAEEENTDSQDNNQQPPQDNNGNNPGGPENGGGRT